jgi:hypothetical protein
MSKGPGSAFPDTRLRGIDPALGRAITMRTPKSPNSGVTHLPGGVSITPAPRRGGAATPPHPWRMRVSAVDEALNVTVQDNGACIERRWTGDFYEIADLAEPLALAEGDNWIYVAGVFDEDPPNDLLSFAIEVDNEKRERIVTEDGEQTGLNIEIGKIVVDGTAATITQRLKVPIIVTQTCINAVPVWVDLVSHIHIDPPEEP